MKKGMKTQWAPPYFNIDPASPWDEKGDEDPASPSIYNIDPTSPPRWKKGWKPSEPLYVYDIDLTSPCDEQIQDMKKYYMGVMEAPKFHPSFPGPVILFRVQTHQLQ